MIAPDLTRRRALPELMDDPGLDPEAHRRALAGLARIHRVSRTAPILHTALDEQFPGSSLRILDVACGDGSVAVQLEDRARRRGREVVVDGLDRSTTALRAARERASRAGTSGRFFPGDLLEDPLPDGYDLVTSSLFLHHLADDQARDLLGRARNRVRRGLLMIDLERTLPGYLVAWAGTRLLSRSPVVHADGPASVRAARSPGELRALAVRAGLGGAAVRRCWPFRLLLLWRRP